MSDDSFDVIVVGAGTAGCVLANRLSESRGTRVLLLEAGPRDNALEVKIPAAFPKLFKSKRDWAYETEPEPQLHGRRIYWPRGKMLGGCSSMNAQIHQWPPPADIEGWRVPGWGAAEISSALRRLERCRGIDSPSRGREGPMRVEALRAPNPMTRAFLAACAALQIGVNPDYNGGSMEGAGLAQVCRRAGRRWSMADACLRPAMRRPNLRVLTEAQACRIEVAGGRAVAVHYRHGGRTMRAGAHEIVLSAGAVGSPQLLMLSGIGPPDHLRDLGIEVAAARPEIGSNLQDHLMAGLLYASSVPASLAGADRLPHLLRWLFMRRGPLSSNVGEAVAFVRSAPEAAEPDVEFIFAPVLYLAQGLEAPRNHGFSIGVVLLSPRSRGRIRLRSADCRDAPAIEANYLGDPDGQDLARMVAGVRLAQSVAKAPLLAPYRAEPLNPADDPASEEQIEAFIREHAHTVYHPVGTCRMGTDTDSVLDARLAVRGVEGLSVVDASVMPTIVRAHPNATVAAIAEHAAAVFTSRAVSRAA